MIHFLLLVIVILLYHVVQEFLELRRTARERRGGKK